MEVVGSARMAELDRLAARSGLPEPALMEAAGRLVAQAVHGLLAGVGRDDPDLETLVPVLDSGAPPAVPGAGRGADALLPASAGPAGGAVRQAGRPSVVVLAGRGRNGGDGMVAARYLQSWGYRVRVLLAGEPAALAGAAAECWRALAAHGVPAAALPAEGGAAARAVEEAVAAADCVVDALLGTGARLPLRPPLADVVAAADRASRRPERAVPVVAVDLPTGVDADTGEAGDPCLRADVTVTFFRPKPGLLLAPGAWAAGRLLLGRIPIPAGLLAAEPAPLRLLTAAEAAAFLPPRHPAGHKGDFGHVVVVGGSVGYSGAPALAAQAALRAGAGLVTLAVPEPIWASLAGKLTEVMVRPLPAAGGGLAAEAWKAVAELVEGRRAVVVAGPGLGRGEGARSVLVSLLSRLDCPLVLDADALNLLRPEEMAGCAAPLVVTPHPGEMGRLLGRPAEEVQRDRLAAARAAWERIGGGAGRERVAVLKGARTLVSAGATTWVNVTGNDGLATAGTGDVLAGLVGGFLAQGAAPAGAAAVSVFLHGLAADLMAARAAPRSLVAGDLLGALGEACAWLESVAGRIPRRPGCSDLTGSEADGR